jgi:hypothetical protein
MAFSPSVFLDLSCDAGVSLIRVTALLQRIQHLLTDGLRDWAIRGFLSVTYMGLLYKVGAARPGCNLPTTVRGPTRNGEAAVARRDNVIQLHHKSLRPNCTWRDVAWSGLGGVATGGAAISPKGIDNMIYTSFRYYIP